MRLNNFPDHRVGSFEAVEGLLTDKGLRAQRAGPGETASFNTVYRAGWYLAHIDYEMPLSIVAPGDRDDYTLTLPAAGSLQACDGCDTVDGDAERAILSSPQRPLLTLTSAHASRINLTVGRDALMRHLVALLGDAPARPPVFAMGLDRTRPQCRSYLDYLWGVIAALEHDAGFLDRPLVGEAVEQALIAGLLLT